MSADNYHDNDEQNEAIDNLFGQLGDIAVANKIITRVAGSDDDNVIRKIALASWGMMNDMILEFSSDIEDVLKFADRKLTETQKTIKNYSEWHMKDWWNEENPYAWVEEHLYGDYTNRAGLMDESNMAFIEKKMKEIDPDQVNWSLNHGAYYSVNIGIRVYDDNFKLTPAFIVYADMSIEMNDKYPILDEDDYSEREYEATHSNIKEAIRYVKTDFDQAGNFDEIDADQMACEVEQYISDHEYDKLPGGNFTSDRTFNGQLESRDDRGAWPDDDAIEAALLALGYLIDPDAEVIEKIEIDPDQQVLPGLE